MGKVKIKTPAEIKKEAGERIKNRREFMRLSQHELAEKIGVKQSTISDWEKGKKAPSLPKIYEMKLAGIKII